ncbi:hypothetical protein NEMIN01_0611 [Nematocida minor]|uniref:uncharacterized protein n=1 Tax=Nematocida minor TaxID=1912983 RepID=UPI002220AE85|nr:uncharacterized protein NEMIN01_0611 [Nematocida minor]KAI5189658.1 hypothetical protein NEMIN01_0611 [Nematocida minor]
MECKKKLSIQILLITLHAFLLYLIITSNALALVINLVGFVIGSYAFESCFISFATIAVANLVKYSCELASLPFIGPLVSPAIKPLFAFFKKPPGDRSENHSAHASLNEDGVATASLQSDYMHYGEKEGKLLQSDRMNQENAYRYNHPSINHPELIPQKEHYLRMAGNACEELAEYPEEPTDLYNHPYQELYYLHGSIPENYTNTHPNDQYDKHPENINTFSDYEHQGPFFIYNTNYYLPTSGQGEYEQQDINEPYDYRYIQHSVSPEDLANYGHLYQYVVDEGENEDDRIDSTNLDDSTKENKNDPAVPKESPADELSDPSDSNPPQDKNGSISSKTIQEGIEGKNTNIEENKENDTEFNLLDLSDTEEGVAHEESSSSSPKLLDSPSTSVSSINLSNESSAEPSKDYNPSELSKTVDSAEKVVHISAKEEVRTLPDDHKEEASLLVLSDSEDVLDGFLLKNRKEKLRHPPHSDEFDASEKESLLIDTSLLPDK